MFFNCTASLWPFPRLVSCTLTVSGCHICHFSTLPLIHLSASLSLLLEACNPLEKHILSEVLLRSCFLTDSTSLRLSPWSRSERSKSLCGFQISLWAGGSVGQRGTALSALSTCERCLLPAAHCEQNPSQAPLTPLWGEVLGCALQFCSKRENSVPGKKTLLLANAATVVPFPSEEQAVHQGNFTLLPRGADNSSVSRHFLLLNLAALWG